MPSVTLEIPAGRVSQLGLTLRRAANEFHGALAREPDAPQAAAWRASADWFDRHADKLLAAQSGVLKFK